MSIHIGSVTLRHGLFLAPLAGVSDRAFRNICRACGAEYTVSEMVSAKALCYEQLSKKQSVPVRTAPLASVFQSEMPLAIQLFGCEPTFMAEAAALIQSMSYRGCVSDTPPAAIDINMGCPVPKIVGNGEGSALMKNPRLAADIVRAVCRATTLPVTVKIRAGWDADSINAPEMARMLEEAGAAAIAVHGRTRAQMYAPSADWRVIEAVKKCVSVPVIGNGDILTADDAIQMYRETGCDGVMVARGALGNPWLFSEISARLEGKAYTPPSLAIRLQTALKQVEFMVEEKGERVAVAEARKHLSWYIKGTEGAAAARSAINSAATLSQMNAIIQGLISGDSV